MLNSPNAAIKWRGLIRERERLDHICAGLGQKADSSEKKILDFDYQTLSGLTDSEAAYRRISRITVATQ